MFLIGGWCKKSKQIADAGLFKCENCNNIVFFELRELANTASLFFIPVATWDKKLYLVCPICDDGHEVPAAKVKMLLQEISSLPSNTTSLEMWNKTNELFRDFVDDGRSLDEWDDYAKAELLKGYESDCADYILACHKRIFL